MARTAGSRWSMSSPRPTRPPTSPSRSSSCTRASIGWTRSGSIPCKRTRSSSAARSDCRGSHRPWRPFRAKGAPAALTKPWRGRRKMTTVPCFGRWQGVYDGDESVDAVLLTAPDGRVQRRPACLHPPAEFVYAAPGYETVVAAGATVQAARGTPDVPGTWRYAWLAGERVVGQGEFVCAPSNHRGYVERSAHDSRYFACTGGEPYVAIGLR